MYKIDADGIYVEEYCYATRRPLKCYEVKFSDSLEDQNDSLGVLIGCISNSALNDYKRKLKGGLLTF